MRTQRHNAMNNKNHVCVHGFDGRRSGVSPLWACVWGQIVRNNAARRRVYGCCERSQNRFTGRVAMLLTALVVLATCLGCGNGRFPIQGEVTFDGKAVEDGTISFEPADGKGSTTGGKIAAGNTNSLVMRPRWPARRSFAFSRCERPAKKLLLNSPPAP